MLPPRIRPSLLVLLVLATVSFGLGTTAGAQPAPAPTGDAGPATDAGAEAIEFGVGELLYSTENNRLRRYDVDTIGTARLAEDVLIERTGDDPSGRDVNGEICFVPDGSGRFIAGEDTGQPSPPAGWGVFEADGTQVGKLTATYNVAGAEPIGCEFAADGTLFTSEVGEQGFGAANGQLMMWFAPYDIFPGPADAYPATNEPSTNFCKLATDLGTTGAVAIDDLGRVYVAQSSGLTIERFSPPFPTSADAAGGCGGTDETGAPVADSVQRETFAVPSDGMLTFSGLAMAPNDNLYAASVLSGHIAEYDLDGNVVRLLLDPAEELPPIPTGHPQGLAVGGDGTVYYTDLDLVGTLPNVSTGPDGRVWRIRFDADDNPLAPEVVRDGLRFPDGLAIAPGNLQEPDVPIEPWPTLAGGPARTFFNPDETFLTPDTVGDLVEKWRFDTEAVNTASPAVATVDLPGVGEKKVVFASSWDGNFYALDFDDGSEIWRFAWEDQPGASFPGAASPTITDIGDRRVALMAAGENLYAIDAATGEEVWRFSGGTGCRDAVTGEFPGLCGFDGERNQIESTPLVTGGTAYFGMDINDVATGKGGFFAVDIADGTMAWYFDTETGATCRPYPGDDVRAYDGYHSTVELGLPADFFATRPGCDHDRSVTGCGNVWSSAAHDPVRSLLYFGSSNCDTDDDPTTPAPGPDMPAFDEALVALHLDGTPAWRWRPREVDPDDLAFGGVPNLFSIDVDGTPTDVVGIGNKDGTYYVLDRDGVNEATGLAWDDPAPRDLPYWETNVVAGGPAGGIIATASVDQAARRVYFSTAPGFEPDDPQRPTVHALDIDTGAVVWQNTETDFSGGDASFGSTSAVPGVVIVGSVITPHLRMYDAEDGTLLYDEIVGDSGTFSGIASGAAVVDGTIVVGAGIGSRTSGGSSPGDFAANTPSVIVALCVPGSPGCVDAEPPVIVPGFASLDENAGTATVTVALSAPAAQPVTVEWETLDDISASAADFIAASGTVTFAPGETQATVTVAIVDDAVDEDEEFVVLRFFAPTNAVMGGFYGLGLVRIIDDDDPPRLLVGSRLAIERDEGTRATTMLLRLSTPSEREVRVAVRTEDRSATAPDDYVAVESVVVFAPGETVMRVPILIVGDREPERTLERFAVEFDDLTNATMRGSARSIFILDDD